jgi:hypothetical protein
LAAWRGPSGTGICDEKNLPVQWSATNHVKWRVPLLERGNSTPVVWADRIFVTQPAGKRRTLTCFSRADGKLLWQSGVSTEEKEPTHGHKPIRIRFSRNRRRTCHRFVRVGWTLLLRLQWQGTLAPH